ncbi:MAG: hypothetical protein K6F73_05200 [Lachnospiraceae bacterium]|nr:hypothetical protein [Lachnospiraceae bacterium]
MKNEREEVKNTNLLYETDGMLTEFEAAVLETEATEDGCRAVLDRTAFFPEGGGQKADTGVLVTEDGSRIRVKDVQTENQKAWHYLEGKLSPGDKVKGEVDAEVRYARMQIHGAEHLLSGIAHNLFGYENTGFHMTDHEAVFDLSGPLSDEQIRDIERRANFAVFENRPITISFPSAKEAREIEYRSKLDTYEGIRLVRIEGYDICACCAPQAKSTGQLGVIKIIDYMPHRGGTRITMTAGMDAYRDYVHLHDSNAEIVAMLSSKREETSESVKDFMERMTSLREENARLSREMTEMVTEKVLRELRESSSETTITPIFVRGINSKGLRDLVNECTKEHGMICAFLEENGGYRYIFAVCADQSESAGLQAFTKEFNASCSGKGGGSALMTEGVSTADRETIEKYFTHLPSKA